MQQKWWSILFGVVNLAALLLFVVAPLAGWWLPRDGGTFGWEVDLLYYLILGITGFFFVLVEAILVYALYTYAGQPGRRAWYVHGNHTLEWAWTIVPGAILLLIAFTQIRAWEHIKYLSHFPEPDQVLEVSARQFEWRIRYPTPETLSGMTNPEATASTADKEVLDAKHKRAKSWEDGGEADDVHVVNELHTWAGAKVRVALKTRDVIHSFFLPTMRLKQDALPGKTIPVWFQPKPTDYNISWDEDRKDWKLGEEWSLACAELCGWGHYKMQGKLFVHKDRADYDHWLAQAIAKQNERQLKTKAE